MSADILNALTLWGPKLIAILAVTAVAYVVIEGLTEKKAMNSRIKAVLVERDRIRARERGKLSGSEPDTAMLAALSEIANRAKLTLWLLDAETQQKLVRAGYRDTSARSIFLALRLLGIAGLSLGFIGYCLLNDSLTWLAGTPLAALIGLRLSTYMLERRIAERDREMNDCAPDIIDLLTVCVESGMSIEHAMQRVAEEMGPRSDIVADELGLTTAELAYVPRRSDAFTNLGQRTNAKSIQDLCISLVQADTYGTSIGMTLRMQSIEARKLRQLEAERKALSIPPKLSLVMVIFFMPVIFIVMLYPTLSGMADIQFGF